MRYTVKPSSIRLRDDFEEYTTSLPLLYEHREEIYANPEYFFAKLPYTIYGLKKSVCIGAILTYLVIWFTLFEGFEDSTDAD